jgi:hypothetical protein
MLKALFIILSLLAAGFVVALLYGAHRWDVGTQELRARLDAARGPAAILARSHHRDRLRVRAVIDGRWFRERFI